MGFRDTTMNNNYLKSWFYLNVGDFVYDGESEKNRPPMRVIKKAYKKTSTTVWLEVDRNGWLSIYAYDINSPENIPHLYVNPQ